VTVLVVTFGPRISFYFKPVLLLLETEREWAWLMAWVRFGRPNRKQRFLADVLAPNGLEFASGTRRNGVE
jgi:hypothetical protein